MQGESEPRHRLTERVVRLLERVVSRTSRVEHDVRLPILTSPRDQAQCDVVVRQGSPPRETVSIVEVQDRDSPVAPNDFRGWVTKMRDVGAQHLIVVSKRPFPGSVQRAAAKLGPMVRLLRLAELEAGKWPLRFHFTIRDIRSGIAPGTTPRFEMEEDGAGPIPETGGFHSKEPLFFVEGQEHAVCMDDLLVAHDAAHGLSGNLNEGEHQVPVRIEADPPIGLLMDGRRIRLRIIEVDVRHVVRFFDLETQFLSYEQVENEGALAWAAIGVGVIDGVVHHMRAVFTPAGDNHYALALIEHQQGGTVSEFAARPSTST